VPLWIYFDGNGYARPASVTPEAYLKSVECQIYTAIVHGATGILFWNDWAKTPEVYEQLLPILAKLNQRLDVVKMNNHNLYKDRLRSIELMARIRMNRS